MTVRNFGNRIDYILTGWNATQAQRLRQQVDWIIEKLVQLAGPSFTTPTLNIRLVPGKSGGVKIFDPLVSENPRIDLGEHYSVKLLIHELYHVWLCPYNLGVNTDLRWTESLAAFEESMAHAAAEFIEEQYQQEHPEHILSINKSTAIYDLRNQDYLTSVSFWSDQNGMGKAYVKYEMGATAIRKILVMRPNFYKEFLGLLAERINTDSDFEFSRELVLNLMGEIGLATA